MNQNVKYDEGEYDDVEIIWQIDGRQCGCEQNCDNATNMGRITT